MTHARGTNSRAMVSTLACLSALGFESCEMPDVYGLKRPYAELSAVYGFSIPGGNLLEINGLVSSDTKTRMIRKPLPIAFSSVDECLAEIAMCIFDDEDFLKDILAVNEEDRFLHLMKFGISIYLDLLIGRKSSKWDADQSLSDNEKITMLKWRM